MHVHTREATTKVLLGDDHAALRAGVASLLTEEGMDVVGQAGTVASVLGLAERRSPDVMVVDVRMPDGTGFDVLEGMRERGLDAPVILYTGFEEPDLVEEALRLGARGFVLKSGPPQGLVQAVRCVDEGRQYLDAALAPLVLQRRERAANRLSARETQVLDLLAAGKTTEAAAGTLFLAPATVRSYVESAMEKLGASNRVHAVAEAIRQGIIV